jgi:hypothetical protein
MQAPQGAGESPPPRHRDGKIHPKTLTPPLCLLCAIRSITTKSHPPVETLTGLPPSHSIPLAVVAYDPAQAEPSNMNGATAQGTEYLVRPTSRTLVDPAFNHFSIHLSFERGLPMCPYTILPYI